MEQDPEELQLSADLDRAFGLLGKRWNGQIIDLLMTRPARFKEISRAIPKLSDKMLWERLRELEEAGLVSHGEDLYSLTEKARGLGEAFEQLRVWGASLES